MAHRIVLERNSLRFAAAHFTTDAAGCEPLHGHNYDVFVEVSGDLTPDSWVMDFGTVKKLVREICVGLDHRFLAAARCPALSYERVGGEVTVIAGVKRYVMPEEDVAFLEIDNTTAERLAEWIALRIADGLRDLGAANITGIAVGVEEMPGQAGWFSMNVAQ
jgi:6-pyruvoyltetrahydropterin/6-carboxytetrahydropterin synthase